MCFSSFAALQTKSSIVSNASSWLIGKFCKFIQHNWQTQIEFFAFQVLYSNRDQQKFHTTQH
jgi:hypothetical protein